MDRSKALAKANNLINLATNASAAPGEASNAALSAVRLIKEHGLLGGAPAPSQATHTSGRPPGQTPQDFWADIRKRSEEASRKMREEEARLARERAAHEAQAKRWQEDQVKKERDEAFSKVGVAFDVQYPHIHMPNFFRYDDPFKKPDPGTKVKPVSGPTHPGYWCYDRACKRWISITMHASRARCLECNLEYPVKEFDRGEDGQLYEME